MRCVRSCNDTLNSFNYYSCQLLINLTGSELPAGFEFRHAFLVHGELGFEFVQLAPALLPGLKSVKILLRSGANLPSRIRRRRSNPTDRDILTVTGFPPASLRFHHGPSVVLVS